MAEIRVAIERVIDAPPDRVYQYVADYRQHHARWLPPEYSNYRVQRGGRSQTTVSYHLKTGSRERDYHMRITETDPGRVVTEQDTGSSLVKSFTIEPANAGSRVRIETHWQGSGGMGGFFERTFAPRVLRALYAVELQRLDAYARQQAS